MFPAEVAEVEVVPFVALVDLNLAMLAIQEVLEVEATVQQSLVQIYKKKERTVILQKSECCLQFPVVIQVALCQKNL